MKLGLFSSALVYAKSTHLNNYKEQERLLEAAALRHAAKRLVETGEGNTHNACILLEQLAERAEHHAELDEDG